MGRKPNTESRRQQIIDALFQEMSTSGYERASTVSIAAQAGLAPGLIHYHFKSKQEILLALIDELIGQANDGFVMAMNSSDSPAEKLAAYVTSRVSLGPRSDKTTVKVWISILAETMSQTEVRSRVAKWLSADHAHLAALFEEAGHTHGKEHASMLLAMILGSFSLHAVGVDGVSKGYAEPQIHAWLGSLVK